MRTVNYSIEKIVSQMGSINITTEEIIRITEDKNNKYVYCEFAISSDSGIVDTREITITGEDYELLMSSNPEFAPNKPANEYREVDIWHMVDLIRARP